MSSYVLDSSAVIALIRHERGWEQLVELLAGNERALGTVNLAEVVAKFLEAGASAADVREAIDVLNLNLVPFESTMAFQTGTLRPRTRHVWLSLGDRACLALASERGAIAVTADSAWAKVDAGIEVRVFR